MAVLAVVVGLAAGQIPAAASVSVGDVQVSGHYRPLAGDFNGDGIGDIFWYGSSFFSTCGRCADALWLGSAQGWAGHTSAPVSVGDDMLPVVGDFNGDHRDDVLWQPLEGGPTRLWTANADATFTRSTVEIGKHTDLSPLVGDFNGDGRDDWFDYGDGTEPDTMLISNGAGSFTVTPTPVNGSYAPVVGDFNGDGRSDIFWLSPNWDPRALDPLWLSRPTGTTFTKLTRRITSTDADHWPGYDTDVGDFNGDGMDDLFTYMPGDDADHYWLATGSGSFSGHTVSVSGGFDPILRNVRGRAHIVWYSHSGTGSREWAYSTTTNRFVSTAFPAVAPWRTPIVGPYRGPSLDAEDIFFYAPGPATDLQTYLPEG